MGVVLAGAGVDAVETGCSCCGFENAIEVKAIIAMAGVTTSDRFMIPPMNRLIWQSVLFFVQPIVKRMCFYCVESFASQQCLFCLTKN
jgi:hypothetical protein